jgi:hypothetical protein
MSGIIYNIKKEVFRIIKKQMSNYWTQKAAEIPKIDLKQKHIANLKTVLTRKDLLTLLPKNAIVAELGVNRGEFSEKILNTCEPTKLHLIDIWGDARYNQQIRKEVENKFDSLIKKGKVEINLGLSTDVVNQFPEKYFDWIYIDTDHSYQTTYAELEKYQSKIKEGGIMAGHDFILGNFEGMVLYGVKEAVYQFCDKYNWEIIYLSMENTIPPSFAIRKI